MVTYRVVLNEEKKRKKSVLYKNDRQKGNLAYGAEGAGRRASGARAHKNVAAPAKTCIKHVLTQKSGVWGVLGDFG